jgi:hypothetical protein
MISCAISGTVKNKTYAYTLLMLFYFNGNFSLFQINTLDFVYSRAVNLSTKVRPCFVLQIFSYLL